MTEPTVNVQVTLDGYWNYELEVNETEYSLLERLERLSEGRLSVEEQ